MTPKNSKPSVIVFDLGGVFAEINHTWQDAAAYAGVSCSKLDGPPIRLAGFVDLDDFDGGRIGADEYLEKLAEFAGCTRDDALKVHFGIHIKEHPGVLELLDELTNHGLTTGCLSNINEPHWELVNGPRYRGISALEKKLASFLVGVTKPSHEIYEKYQETYGFEPDSLLFFDDNLINVDAAVACGWSAKLIDPLQEPLAQIRNHLRDLDLL